MEVFVKLKLFAVLALVSVLSVTGTVSATETPAEKTPLTFEAWEALSADEQKDLLGELPDVIEEWESDDGQSETEFEAAQSEIRLVRYVVIKDREYERQEKLFTAAEAQKAVALYKKGYAEAIGEFEVDGEFVTSVGEPSVSLTVYLLNGQLLAVRFGLFQDGAGHDTESYGPHFDTEEEARAAGWDTGADVSWSNHFTVNHRGEVMDSNGYWEWSGY